MNPYKMMVLLVCMCALETPECPRRTPVCVCLHVVVRVCILCVFSMSVLSVIATLPNNDPLTCRAS